MSLFGDLSEICRANAPLAPLTWFRLGGPAEWLIEPRTEEELSTVLHRCREAGVAVRFLGLGANLLVSEAGVRGAVVRLAGPVFERIEICGTTVEAGGAAELTKLVRATVNAALAGLEVLAGIPGTVGGGVRMNCGGRYGEIADCVERVRLVSANGERRERSREEMRFSYRRAEVGCDIVAGATFRLKRGEPGELLARFREIWRYKSESQPPLEEQSAGCIFKNPPGERSAGRLIDEAGLKGLRVGGAEVSERHANFVVAHAGATSGDVLRLIEQVEERVFSRTGVRLEREVEVW